MQALNYTTQAQLKREVTEAMEQIEQGEFMGIDEAFDRVICLI